MTNNLIPLYLSNRPDVIVYVKKIGTDDMFPIKEEDFLEYVKLQLSTGDLYDKEGNVLSELPKF